MAPRFRASVASLLSLAFIPASFASFYGSNDKVVNLTPANFKSQVLDSDELWLIEFYAPWCGHCKSLTPAWKSAAEDLDGIINIGAVNADEHKSLGGKFGVQGFPTIKIFGFDKDKPQDYKGGRGAEQIVDEAYKQLKKMGKDKKAGKDKKSGGGSSGGGSSGGGRAKSDKDVVILTDDNFDREVTNSEEPFIIEFYAPWCGHCQRLEPEWNEAAAKIKEQTGGKVKIAKVDCTTNQGIAQRFGVQGYPTIKIFHTGRKDSPEDYNAGRTASDVITVAMALFEAVRDPPELRQLIDGKIFEDKCKSAQLCLVFALPDILDDQSEERNKRIAMIKVLTEKYKTRAWEWWWTEAGKQPALEELMGIGGFGYPALAAVNIRKLIRTTQTGAFTESGISDYLTKLAAGRTGRNVQAIKELPVIATVDKWDGKDRELYVMEDDLGDFDWDDEPEDDSEEPPQEEVTEAPPQEAATEAPPKEEL